MFKLVDSFPNAHKAKREELLYSFRLIKVLVVDHKKDLLAYVAGVLHSCSFQVTCVDNSGAALKLLSEKMSEFDLVLIDSGMGDVDIHTFLRLTKNTNLLFIVMSEKDDDEFLLKAFESGAFLVLKRPLTMDAVMHIRQDVMRERTFKHIKRKNKNMILKAATQELKLHENGSCGSKKRYQSWEEDGDDDHEMNVNINVDGRMKKKVCIEWTKELHDKFLGAIRQLGEGRCYPKKILELMGVPGLTRMQVASHLQKCRKEVFKFNEKHKSVSSLLNQTFPSNLVPFGVNERRFGSMPALQTHPNDQEESSALIGINLSINRLQTEVSHMNNQTYRSSSTTNISNRTNIAQRIQYTQFPIHNALGSDPNEEIGSRITKTTGHYFQQAISGVRDAGQCSNHHIFSTNQRQTCDDFPDFLRDLDGNGPNDI